MVDESCLLLVAIGKVNGYLEKSNESKQLTVVLTDESNDTEKIWSKIRDLNRSQIYENQI